MLLRILVAGVTWCLCSAALSADEAPDPTFGEIAAQLAAPKVLRGNFEQIRSVQLISRPLESSGRFILSEMGLYWQQDEPIALVMIADGERLVQRIGDGPPDRIDPTGGNAILLFSQSFLSIFEGSEDALRENFEVEFSPRDDGSWAIELAPVSYPMSEAIETIVVAGREYIEELQVLSRTSEQTIIRFTDLQTEPDHLTDHEAELYAR